MVKKNAIEYINLPRKYKLSDYHHAIKKFVDKYSAHPDVISIYLFGNISVLGISDLDFIVVLKDKLSVPFTEDYSVLNFQDDLRYLYNNTQPFLMNRNVFKNCRKIFPFKNLRLVYGENINNEIQLHLIFGIYFNYKIIIAEQSKE